ncbi:MAG: DUF2939 domain-containing protein [Deltaproteobacteria bacterium]|nr:DUF2939 domain-containing protein [Deltaproteobacteria bacterium]
MKKIALATALLLALGAGCTGLFPSAQTSLREMSTSACAGDAQGFYALVDREATEASLQTQLREQLGVREGKGDDNLFGQLVQGFAAAVADSGTAIARRALWEQLDASIAQGPQSAWCGAEAMSQEPAGEGQVRLKVLLRDGSQRWVQFTKQDGAWRVTGMTPEAPEGPQ